MAEEKAKAKEGEVVTPKVEAKKNNTTMIIVIVILVIVGLCGLCALCGGGLTFFSGLMEGIESSY
jgi:flagellar basal body-associated protein FliL